MKSMLKLVNACLYWQVDEEQDDEVVYKRAAVMSDCGGLAMMLQRSGSTCLLYYN